MKTLKLGAIFYLSACIGLIPSCKPKENADIPRPRAEHEVIITLQSAAGATPAPESWPTIMVDSRQGRASFPLEQGLGVKKIVAENWMKYKTKSIVVVRADPDELAWRSTRVLRALAASTLHKTRFEVGDIQAAFLVSTGLTGSKSPGVWHTGRPGEE